MCCYVELNVNYITTGTEFVTAFRRYIFSQLTERKSVTISMSEFGNSYVINKV